VREKLAGTEAGQRAIVLFSDGEDNSSAYHMLDAIEMAQGESVRLYTLQYTESRRGMLNARNKYGIRVMDRLARETGGTAYDAREGGLARHFHAIGEELRTSYELGYYSTNPKTEESFRKISILVKREGLMVRAKTGYFAR
jgi:Ca-activated chloride channel family protein